MNLSAWRIDKGLGFAETARMLGIEGVNPGGTLARIERGERRPDADMIDRIEVMTGGVVTASDMHRIRLAWLREHRPEKFQSVELPLEAAE